MLKARLNGNVSPDERWNVPGITWVLGTPVSQARPLLSSSLLLSG